MDAVDQIQVQVELRGPDLERLIVVGGDLEYLRGLPNDRLPTHTEVRLCAGILRRLLIDNQLMQLLRTIGVPKTAPPAVEATEIDSALDAWPNLWVRYAWAGGASAAGANHSGMVLAVIPKAEIQPYGTPEAFMKANPLPVTGQVRQMAIGAWLSSTSVAIQATDIGLVRISRQSMIKYIANRKGGVHFDPGRNLTIQKDTRKRREVESLLLDHGLLRVGHLSGPEFEVASMVQALASTEWARGLVQAAKQAAPDDFRGDPYELKFWTGEKEADGTGWATSRFGSTSTSSSPGTGGAE